MPWPRNEPDPLESKRRELLADKMSQLRHELQHGSPPTEDELKRAEPPVWRLEEEAAPPRVAESLTVRRRNLASQRRRDMIRFSLCVALLLIALIVFLWIFNSHNATVGSGM